MIALFSRMKHLAYLASLGFSLAYSPSFVHAQGGGSAREAELERRVRELEETVRELKAALPRLVAPAPAVPPNGGNAVGLPAQEGGGLLKESDVASIIEQYLQKKDSQKQQPDAAKKREFVEVGSDLTVKGSWRPGTWRDGLYFDTPNKDFSLHVGGRVHWDAGWFTTSSDKAMPAYNDAMGFRRARLRGDGTIWEVINFVDEIDFANPDGTADKAVFTDVYLEVTQLPYISTFRAGHFKEPFSLDELIGDNDVPFLERSLINQAFVPSRHLGVMAMNPDLLDGRMSVAVGMFRNTSTGDKGFDSGDGEYSETVRVTWLPLWRDEGRCLWEVGAAYSHRSFNTSNGPRASFNSRTPIRLGTPILLSTGDGGLFRTTGSIDLWGAETALVWGPFSLQSEIIAAQVENNEAAAPKNGAINPNPFYWGTYVQASYFLTGEHRPWLKKRAAFGPPQPHERFYLVQGEDGRPQFGRGAWEVLVRWDYLDLHSDGFKSSANAGTSVGGTGVLQDVIFGVNWYWNANARWQFDYIRTWRDSDTKGKSGTVDALGIRFLFYF